MQRVAQKHTPKFLHHINYNHAPPQKKNEKTTFWKDWCNFIETGSSVSKNQYETPQSSGFRSKPKRVMKKILKKSGRYHFLRLHIFCPINLLGQKIWGSAPHPENAFCGSWRGQGGSSRERNHRMRLEKWSWMMGVSSPTMQTTRRYEQIKIWRRRSAPLPMDVMHQ